VQIRGFEEQDIKLTIETESATDSQKHSSATPYPPTSSPPQNSSLSSNVAPNDKGVITRTYTNSMTATRAFDAIDFPFSSGARIEPGNGVALKTSENFNAFWQDF